MAGQPLPRAIAYMASVSFDWGVILIGKNGTYISIILSIIGGYGGGQIRSEILSYNGDSWFAVGQLGNARYYTAATRIMLNTTATRCNKGDE